MHYLLHYPDQLLNYGPIRNHWCMRYESKDGFLSRSDGIISVMFRYRWQHFIRIMCLQMLGMMAMMFSKEFPLTLRPFHFKWAGCCMYCVTDKTLVHLWTSLVFVWQGVYNSWLKILEISWNLMVRLEIWI